MHFVWIMYIYIAKTVSDLCSYWLEQNPRFLAEAGTDRVAPGKKVQEVQVLQASGFEGAGHEVLAY